MNRNKLIELLHVRWRGLELWVVFSVVAFIGLSVYLSSAFPRLAFWVNARSTVTDPFIHPALFGLALVLAAGIAVGLILVINGNWRGESLRVRAAILDYLHVPVEQPDVRAASEQILALVPCQGRQLAGPLAGLGGHNRVWLCFLDEQLLVVSGASGKVAALSAVEVRKLSLRDKDFRKGFGIAIETAAGTSILDVQRLDDLARIVNVLIQKGIVLGYQE